MPFNTKKIDCILDNFCDIWDQVVIDIKNQRKSKINYNIN